MNHCINFTENSCDSCDNSETMSKYTDGNRRYKVVITNKNASGVSIEATGYKGPYNRTISAGIKYAGFTCGDDYLGIMSTHWKKKFEEECDNYEGIKHFEDLNEEYDGIKHFKDW